MITDTGTAPLTAAFLPIPAEAGFPINLLFPVGDPMRYGAKGDGVTNDRPAWLIADTVATAATRVIIPSAGSYRIATSLMLANPVDFRNRARINNDLAATITFNGGLYAIARQQLFIGSGPIRFGSGVVDVVYSEWWGAIATNTATIAGVNNCTTAIAAALATGENLRFLKGCYGSNAGQVINAISQQMTGAGMPTTPDYNTGTALVRLTAGFFFRATQTDNYISDLGFDGSNLSGSMLELFEQQQSCAARLTFRNQGGTDKAIRMFFAGYVNEVKLYDLHIIDGGMSIENALYVRFFGCEVDGGSVEIGSVGGIVANIEFHGFYCEPSINIHDECSSIKFFGLAGEANNSAPAMTCFGPLVQGVTVDGWNYNRQAASTPLVDMGGGAINLRFYDLHIRDQSTAGTPLFRHAEVHGLTIEGGDVYCDNNCPLLLGTGATRADNVTVAEIYGHSGGTISVRPFATNFTLRGGNLDLSFLPGSGSASVIASTGAVDRTNVSSISLMEHNGALTGPENTTNFRSHNNTFSIRHWTQAGLPPAPDPGDFYTWDDTVGTNWLVATNTSGVTYKVAMILA